MNMEKTLEKVVRRFVLPMNDRLVDVKVGSAKNAFNDYKITYFTSDRVDFGDCAKIAMETRTFFNMLGPKEGSNVIINFRSINDEN